LSRRPSDTVSEIGRLTRYACDDPRTQRRQEPSIGATVLRSETSVNSFRHDRGLQCQIVGQYPASGNTYHVSWSSAYHPTLGLVQTERDINWPSIGKHWMIHMACTSHQSSRIASTSASPSHASDTAYDADCPAAEWTPVPPSSAATQPADLPSVRVAGASGGGPGAPKLPRPRGFSFHSSEALGEGDVIGEPPQDGDRRG
jgi:hypothetical protein